MSRNEPTVSLIPLGGVGEIGKNMMVVETDKDIMVIDAGVAFPGDDLPGIDLVIPDISYLVENREKIRAIVLTHGHEDHVGALPYVLRQLPVPVYGTRLTLGLVKGKLAEHNLAYASEFITIVPGRRFQVGGLEIEPIHVNHSIADVVALAVHTPVGVVVYASDFKFDQTPVDGDVTDYHKLAELGDKGVTVLLSDSTNAERPGYTLSERLVGKAFLDAFSRAPGRILVATFASNVHRIQQIMDASAATGRKVCVVGRSMENVVGVASELSYLKIPEGILIPIEALDRYSPERLTVITTGSQGEPMSALSRVAAGEHKRMEILPGDTVIISASPIPGNERLIGRIIDQLFRQGATVIYEAFSGMHVSGHASQEELKLMLNLCRPRFFIPVHGEYRMLVKHAELAEQVGLSHEQILLAGIGDVVQVGQDRATRPGKVPAGPVFVDGLGVGDVGNVVLRDRRQLAQDGILVVVVTVGKLAGETVAGPEIVSRGFVYVKESESLLEEAKEEAGRIIAEGRARKSGDWNSVKAQLREGLARFLWARTMRRPMILPVIVEV
ncbi:MAG: ribonuclease J [Firmicutes bacterium]|nr:ribonuclease J [Bacillota bacterium]